MRYFEDMSCKYGFGDGGSVPPDAFDCREVYVRVLNALLERHQSAVRVVAYNRPGMHNSCMILRVPLAVFETLPADPAIKGLSAIPSHDPVTNDDAYETAFAEAMEMDLDDCVICKVSIHPGALRKALRTAGGGKQLHGKPTDSPRKEPHAKEPAS